MSEFVNTAEAAKRLGISRRTLQDWWARGLVEPDWVTPGGHARWDADRLLADLRALRQRDE